MRGDAVVGRVLVAVQFVEENAQRHCALAWADDKPWDCDCPCCAAVRVPGVYCDCPLDAARHALACPTMGGLEATTIGQLREARRKFLQSADARTTSARHPHHPADAALPEGVGSVDEVPGEADGPRDG